MKRTTSPKAARAPAPVPYTPTEQERAATRRVLDRRKRRAPAPRYKVVSDGQSVTINPEHPELVVGSVLLADALGTGDGKFAEGLLGQLANVSQTKKEVTASELNFMVATVHGIGPRDPTEALLASQMAAIHNATMMAARRLNHIETIDQQDSASNMLNKLARTFAAQVEALKKYRSTGEQSIRVQHVTVNEGGQAIVGSVQTGGGGDHENASQSHAIGAAQASGPSDAPGPAMLGHEQAFAMPMPGTSRKGAECLPNARGASRSADREG